MAKLSSQVVKQIVCEKKVLFVREMVQGQRENFPGHLNLGPCLDSINLSVSVCNSLSVSSHSNLLR